MYSIVPYSIKQCTLRQATVAHGFFGPSSLQLPHSLKPLQSLIVGFQYSGSPSAQPHHGVATLPVLSCVREFFAQGKEEQQCTARWDEARRGFLFGDTRVPP